MRKLSLLAVGILAVTLSGLPLQASEKEDSPDPRLSKPITVQCVNARLSEALEKIAETSGVTIRAGKDNKDWPVRDIPVVVCTKDAPLGVVLHAITDSTRLLLSRTKVEDSYQYRVWRDLKREKEMADYKQAIDAYAHAEALYTWDQWAQFKDIPDSAFKPNSSDEWKQEKDNLRLISGVMSSLGSESRDKVILSEEPMTVNFTNVPGSAKKTLTDYLRSAWKQDVKYLTISSGEGQPQEPVKPEATDDDLAGCGLQLSFKRFDLSEDYPKLTVAHEVQIKKANTGLIMDKFVYLPDLKEKLQPEALKQLQQEPKKPKYPSSGNLNTRYEMLNIYKNEQPILKQKAMLEEFKENRKPTFADCVAAASAAFGITIICEDFQSHVWSNTPEEQSRKIDLLGKEVTLQRVLQLAPHMNWYYDEKNKTFIGSEKDWVARCSNMVPKALLDNLTAKLDGPGVELDDLDPLAKLSEDQRQEWIQFQPELQPIQENASSCTRNLWPLYFELNSADKAKAKTEAGLSLAPFDQVWVSDILQRRANITHKIPTFEVGFNQSAKDDAFPDSGPVSNLTLRVKTEQNHGKIIYSITVEGQKDGKTLKLNDYMGKFPIYSAKREAELQKEKAAASKQSN